MCYVNSFVIVEKHMCLVFCCLLYVPYTKNTINCVHREKTTKNTSVQRGELIITYNIRTIVILKHTHINMTTKI